MQCHTRRMTGTLPSGSWITATWRTCFACSKKSMVRMSTHIAFQRKARRALCALFQQALNPQYCACAAARERVVGWYSTGPRLREADLDITSLMSDYCETPLLVICEVQVIFLHHHLHTCTGSERPGQSSDPCCPGAAQGDGAAHHSVLCNRRHQRGAGPDSLWSLGAYSVAIPALQSLQVKCCRLSRHAFAPPAGRHSEEPEGVCEHPHERRSHRGGGDWCVANTLPL